MIKHVTDATVKVPSHDRDVVYFLALPGKFLQLLKNCGMLRRVHRKLPRADIDRYFVVSKNLLPDWVIRNKVVE